MTTPFPTEPTSEASPRPPLRVAAGATEVVFEWAGDRWHHRVHVARVGGAALVAESVEGAVDAESADPRWPASPVITDLLAADAAGGPSLVGLGAAGRSHFSLAVTRHPSIRDTLLFEVACRLHERPARLGSTYRRISPPCDVVTLAPVEGTGAAALPRTIRWTYTIGPGGIVTG